MAKVKNQRRQVQRMIPAESRINGPLDEAIAYLQEIKEKHPKAQLTEHWTGYEDMELVFSWWEDETDEEMQSRLAEEQRKREAQAAEAKRIQERKAAELQIEALKRKHGIR